MRTKIEIKKELFEMLREENIRKTAMIDIALSLTTLDVLVNAEDKEKANQVASLKLNLTELENELNVIERRLREINK